MQQLLLLHGAAGSKQRLQPLKDHLSRDFDVYSMNFSGHGGEPFPEETFSIEMFAMDVINFMNKNEIRQIHIFGYSMGGFVALYLAAHYPERVLSVFTLGTKFNWNRDTVKMQVKLLDAEVIEEKLPEYAREMEQIHAPNDWKEMLEKTIEMLKIMGKKNPLGDDDLQGLEIPVLIGMGDRDNMVIIEESVFSFRLLKKGQLFIMPDTPHPITRVRQDRLASEIRQFVGKVD